MSEVKTVRILKPGYGQPVGESKSRIINPREVIQWDGPLPAYPYNWMVEVGSKDDPGDDGAAKSAAPHVPAAIRRAMERAGRGTSPRELVAMGDEMQEAAKAPPPPPPATRSAPRGKKPVEE